MRPIVYKMFTIRQILHTKVRHNAQKGGTSPPHMSITHPRVYHIPFAWHQGGSPPLPTEESVEKSEGLSHPSSRPTITPAPAGAIPPPKRKRNTTCPTAARPHVIKTYASSSFAKERLARSFCVICPVIYAFLGRPGRRLGGNLTNLYDMYANRVLRVSTSV